MFLWTGSTRGPSPSASGATGRSSFLIVGLAALSWVATYVGMLELIQSNMGVAAAFAQSHHRLLGRHADDHDRVAARPDVLAASTPGHQALLRRRLHLPDHHLGGLRLRLLLEGAGKPLRGLALGDERRRPGAVLAARRLDAAGAAAGDASAAVDHLRATRPRSSAPRAPRAPTARPATARAARCATRTPPASPSPPSSSRDASAPSSGDMAALDAQLAKIVADDPVDHRSQERHTQRVHARARPPPRHDGDGLQCVPHRSAAAPDPHRPRRPRRALDHCRRQERHHLVPGPAVADGAARRRARHRPAAEPGEAGDRRRGRLGSDDRGLPAPDHDVLRAPLLQAAALVPTSCARCSSGPCSRSRTRRPCARSTRRPPACRSATTSRWASPSSSTCACCSSPSAGR